MVVDLLAPGSGVTSPAILSLLAKIGTMGIHVHFVYDTKESTGALQL